MIVADCLKTTRQKCLLTQEEFAREIGVSVTTIIRWENQKSIPNISAMKNIKQFCMNHNMPYDTIEVAWLSSKKEVMTDD